MGRIRSVKPEYWSSEQVMAISRDARLVFIGMWNFADDNGVHPANAQTLKAKVLPGDDDITADGVLALVDQMIDQELVEEYDGPDGKAYWRITGWRLHQRIDRPTYRYPTALDGDVLPGDAGDTGDAKGDASDTRHPRVTGDTGNSYRRLGGKQRQLVLRKLRERDGNSCHLCTETNGLTILSLVDNEDENPNEISNLRLVCGTCKRRTKRGDTKKSTNTRRALDGDSTVTRLRSGVERIGEDRSNSSGGSTTTSSATASPPASPASQEPGLPLGDLWGQNEGSAPAIDPVQQRAIDIVVRLRKQGVKVTAMHPAVVDWSARNVPIEIIEQAVRKARDTLGNSVSLHANYLVPIIKEIQEGAAVLPGPGRPTKFDPVAHVNRNRRKP